MPASIHAPPPGPMKRPRSDYPDVSGGPDFRGYHPREEERVAQRSLQDTESIEASYERYLRTGSYGTTANESGRPLAGGAPSHPADDPHMMSVGSVGSVGSVDRRNVVYGAGRPEMSRRPEMSLPPDASNTLFVEGLTANCSRREVSHIFRPFVGFREVRLVNKESRNPGGEPIVLCFVDFSTPGQSTLALDALQGYKFDEHDRDSPNLRIQYARFPGPRSASGSRSRR